MAAALQPQTQQLELAHVLVVDIAGCSSLPVSQQGALLENLQEFVHCSREFGRARAQEQITVVPSGHGMALVFFGDPEAPLRCAVEISRSARNAEKICLRMGLHSWPVCRLDDLNLKRTVSDGGNQRSPEVTDCGDQGHILVSEFVADLIQQLGRWKDALHDLGEVEVKQGVRLHLFNFWNSEAGNPKVPNKLFRLDPRENKDEPGGGILSETVSHYRILRKLGGGGMGVVYEAEDTRLGRHVAIKLLSEKFSKNPSAIERFQREACTASSLNHPHICTIHDVGEHAGRHFIVMELLEGKTLRQAIASGPLPADEMVALGIQIADGLEAAHKRGIVHRDIKPANLFVIEPERIKILDFGLAKLTGRDRNERISSDSALDDDEPTRQTVTTPGEFVGTVSYMSPEQARGERLDHRTDLFSFGVVLYEMATGMLPFRGDTSAVVFDSILNHPPSPAMRVNPQVSPELDRVICRALEKHRETRYQSAADMGAELRRLAMRTSASVAAAPFPSRKRKNFRWSCSTGVMFSPTSRSCAPWRKDWRARVTPSLWTGTSRSGWTGRTRSSTKSGPRTPWSPCFPPPRWKARCSPTRVQLAHSFSERQNGKPRLLPVRVQFHAELPDSLHSALEGLNYAFWKDPADNDQIVAELAKALRLRRRHFAARRTWNQWEERCRSIPSSTSSVPPIRSSIRRWLATTASSC